MSDNIESIKSLAARIRRLAEEGKYEGERAAAQRKLDAMLAKHGLTIADIDDDKREPCYLMVPVDEKYWIRLLYQVMAKHFPESNVTRIPVPEGQRHKFRGQALFVGEFTKAEYIEAKDMYIHYRDDWRKQSRDFYGAYIQQQDLGVSLKDDQKSEMTEDERQRLMRKMNSIDEAPHQKKLAG